MPTPGQNCTAPGALECLFPSDNCCCGQCEEVFFCASDSTTGGKIWQLRHVCPAGCSEGEHILETLHLSLTLKHLATGIVTSPDYPANYPSGLAKPTTIQVEPGRVIRLQFTAFHTANCNDHLAIMDGDGTTLMEKACGASLPTNITSASNTINMLFKTDGSGSTEGWSVSWVAVTPGESTMSREDDVFCLWFYVDKRSIIVVTSSDFCFIQKNVKLS